MTLSFVETQAVAELAQHLYSYLPGSSRWPGTFTFEHAARAVGVGDFWPGGSKLPAITLLLELTLTRERRAFCPLIETIVRHGIKYRARVGPPYAREDLDELNGLVAKVGFKIPDLHDVRFREALPTRFVPPAEEPRVRSDDRPLDLAKRLPELKTQFLALHKEADRQTAGRSFEKLLFELFDLCGLNPRGSFGVVGEQIDGSIVLDNEAYLAEAKWLSDPVELRELLIFREKVLAKSSFTRGLFIAINGYTAGAREGIIRGKQPNFLMLDGMHMYRVLDDQISLVEMLRRVRRHLADTGDPYLTATDARLG